jgi:hypothetical protein
VLGQRVEPTEPTAAKHRDVDEQLLLVAVGGSLDLGPSPIVLAVEAAYLLDVGVAVRPAAQFA